MNSAELWYWEQKYRHEFLGDQRGDFRAAQVCSAIANFAGRSLVDGVTKAPIDYMIFQPEQAKEDEDDFDEVAFKVQMDTAVAQINSRIAQAKLQGVAPQLALPPAEE